MKRSLLERLRSNGMSYLISAALLILIIPLYQLFYLNPLGYGNALHLNEKTPGADLLWISSHSWQFALYRLLLAIAFLLLFTLPFSLYRIIVAQEIVARQEREAEAASLEEETDEEGEDEDEEIDEEEATSESRDEEFDEESYDYKRETDGMPAAAWRGQGFAIIAVWAGIAGVILYVVGTLASTLYAIVVSGAMPSNYALVSTIFTLLAQTGGVGLLALSTLFFGAIIARSGRNLWPGSWVAFGYLAIATAALLSGSAVAVASAPAAGQATLTTPAVLLFALWVLWFGVMLIRLKPEA
jgi:hypothetical protein